MESLEYEALGDYRKLYDFVRRHLRALQHGAHFSKILKGNRG